MKVVYISSPYSSAPEEGTLNQIKAAHKIMDMGHAPLAPLLSHYLHEFRARPYEDWMDVDLALVPKCDIVLRLKGESSGADREVKLAFEHDIPVAFGWDELKDILQHGD